jgi:hypothetical protein
MTRAVLLKRCPACGGDVTVEDAGAGRCRTCAWRCRIDGDGRVTDAIPSWMTAGRKSCRPPRRRGAVR